ncbi:MAG: hypothetical protein LBV51_01830 [Acholeplasmatales bacterium]|jgi:ABC-type multidrug transport system fused ATPase/permease subunit|nr:hypothetical protein [Acholeplasmatales bacterium]
MEPIFLKNELNDNNINKKAFYMSKFYTSKYLNKLYLVILCAMLIVFFLIFFLPLIIEHSSINTTTIVSLVITFVLVLPIIIVAYVLVRKKVARDYKESLKMKYDLNDTVIYGFNETSINTFSVKKDKVISVILYSEISKYKIYKEENIFMLVVQRKDKRFITISLTLEEKDELTNYIKKQASIKGDKKCLK